MERLARAKVNLFLHVGPPAADGFHPVCSLMAFADLGDRIALDCRARGLRIEGPFAPALVGEGDNLVLRARDALLAAAGRDADFGLVLEKALPVASGLGGGSSDAAAALVLVREALDLDVSDETLLEIAGRLGSDTPACVAATSVIARGRGERLSRAPILPPLPAVLVNPGVASPTGPVYRAYDQAVSPQGADDPAWLAAVFETAAAVASALAEARNDLEAPAVRLQPAIGAALSELAAAPETLLARMSGSGATCFSLCADAAAASALAQSLARAHPDWWVRACTIG